MGKRKTFDPPILVPYPQYVFSMRLFGKSLSLVKTNRGLTFYRRDITL